MQIKPLCVWHITTLFFFFHGPVGESPWGFTSSHPPPPQYHHQNLHSHPVFMCLYFNSSPGATSLLNAFSDIFSDHFYNLATRKRLQLKNSTRERHKKEISASAVAPFDEYFSSEIKWLKSFGGKVANKKSCVTSLRSAGVVERFEGVAETDGTPHPHFARLHPSESREGNSEDRSAVEYKIRHWRNQKTNLRRGCVCVCVGIDFGSHFILVVEHQYQTLVFHSGRIIAYCLWRR